MESTCEIILEGFCNTPVLNRANVSDDFFKILASFFVDKSPLTRKAYEHACRSFFSFVASRDSSLTKIADLKRHHLIFYRQELEREGLANKTILKRLSAVSSMAKFLAEEGLVDRDITYGIKRPRTVNKKETADFKDSEVLKLLNAFDGKRIYDKSHRAMLAVGFFTGLRASSIRTLKVKNFDRIDGHHILTNLTVKGGKKHEVVLPPLATRYLMEHIEHLKGLGFALDEEHYLFPSLKTKRNQPMGAKSFYVIFRNCIRKADLDVGKSRRLSTHSMRATVASHLLNERGAKLEEVQDFLGHSSPSTTRLYDKRKRTHDRSPAYLIQY